MKRILLSAALLAAATTSIQAHTLDGIVKDNKTGEPLIGTVIRVKELPNVSTTTGLDGTFTLNELPDKGKFTIIVSYMSYKTRKMVVDVAKKDKVDIPMDEDLKLLGEVVVTGHREYRSDRSAIETVKNAGNVLNVMSQQSIQLSPDVNVASVLQRVSGVTMERDASGEASYAILRGMDKRYNYTLVNGVKIPSPDDKNRYIPLNIFPINCLLETAPCSCPMVIFFKSMETTRSPSRCPAESAKANRTFFSGSAAASALACTLFPTKTMFFVRFARSVSRTESSCV